MQGPWLPTWLYRLLPLIYVVLGVVVLRLSGDETYGQLSALLLFAAAVLIWALRLNARRTAPRRE